MKIPSYDFVWNCYKSADIASVIGDIELSTEDYKFYFVLDTYDVVENYLPYTEIELFSKGPTNQLAQKYICYDYLFDKSNNTQIILPGEYKIELLAAKNKLQRNLGEARAVLNNLQKLKNETPDFSNYQKTTEFFKKHFEIILLLLIINNKKTKILDEFHQFVRDRLLTSEINSFTEDEEKINTIFQKNTSTKLSVEIFKDWIEENKVFLVSIEDDNHRHIFLESTFRDIKVIERLMRINLELRAQGLKYAMIYISTAQKTPSLYKIIESKFRTDNTKQKIDFHRNVFQYFLFKKLSTDYKNDSASALSILSSLHGSMEKLEDIKAQSLNVIPEDALIIIKKVFQDASSALDNHFYLSIYQKYKGAFSILTNDNSINTTSEVDVQKILQEIDKNSELKSELSNLLFNLTQINQSLDAISMLDSPERRVPKDIIRNSYQHLPILLFYPNRDNKVIIESLYHFINIIIESGKNAEEKKSDEAQKISNKLNTILAALGTPGNAREKLTRSIIISYTTLFVNIKNQDEESLINDFNTYLEIIKAIGLKINIAQSSATLSITSTSTQISLVREICYILLWLYRRNDKEDDGITLGQDLIATFPKDARISQGIGLCYLSKAYKSLDTSTDTTEKTIELFNQAYMFLHEADTLFDYEINNIPADDYLTRQLIMKSQTAILNSLCNIKLRIMEQENKFPEERIEEGMVLLTKIKNLFCAMNLKYENHVTYLGTEIELLYYQALSLKTTAQIGKARSSIIHASIQLSQLRSLDNYKYANDFFKKRFSKLPGLMAELMLSK